MHTLSKIIKKLFPAEAEMHNIIIFIIIIKIILTFFIKNCHFHPIWRGQIDK